MTDYLTLIVQLIGNYPIYCILIVIILYQQYRIRQLRGDSDAWYTLWLDKTDQLSRMRKRRRKQAQKITP